MEESTIMVKLQDGDELTVKGLQWKKKTENGPENNSPKGHS
ncbi:MAG TPA: hypothetical protein VF691_03860 [Cytophagaceae bacterium]|jgi:hypothetical protein